VTFLDSSEGSPASWVWDFGDGAGSTDQNPTHVYATTGHYVATLRATNARGSDTKSQDVAVIAQDTLRLNVAGQHPFLVTIAARNPSNGQAGPGFAIPQTDIFGYFSLPALTEDPGNPEVFVKVIDGNVVNGHYWVFFGGLTDLEYTLTVQDELTGESKPYFKQAGSADGGSDTSAFPASAPAITSAWLANHRTATSWLSGFASAFPSTLRPEIARQSLVAETSSPVINQVTRFDVENSGFGPHQFVWLVQNGTATTQSRTTDSRTSLRFLSPGDYRVSATDILNPGRGTASSVITATDIDELRLLYSNDPVRPSPGFSFRLTARDQGSGRIASGSAFANTDRFGSFSLPGITGNPNNAEVVVKELDGRGVNGNYWTFYGGLTDLQWTLSARYNDLSLSKYYFKDSLSVRGGWDTSGFEPNEQPTISSMSPITGPFGTTIRLLGTNLYSTTGEYDDLIEPFIDDSVGHLKNTDFPVVWLGAGYDSGSGLQFTDLQITNPKGLSLTNPYTAPLSLAVNHYLATAPVPFTILPQGTQPTATPVPSATPTRTGPSPTPNGPTPTPTPQGPTPTPRPPTPTATAPPPTATPTPAPGGPVITSTTADIVTGGDVFDAFGTGLGPCSSILTTFRGSLGTYVLPCQFGDSQSVQVQVPPGATVPNGFYNFCVTVNKREGCTNFQMEKR
jgi:PKD repeat protein